LGVFEDGVGTGVAAVAVFVEGKVGLEGVRESAAGVDTVVVERAWVFGGEGEDGVGVDVVDAGSAWAVTVMVIRGSRFRTLVNWL
jgi:hypothetical protein